MKLREILKSSDSNYYSKFEHIKSSVISIISNSRCFFPSYTNHDFNHLKNVENYINEILLENTKNELNSEEIFCLLSAAWLHDVGMIPFDNEKEDYENKTKKEREEYRENIREEHHIRSSLYVDKHKNELNINEFEAKAIGNICKGHRQTDLNTLKDIPYNQQNIRVNSLAAILRLADECDISKARDSCLSFEGINSSTKEQHYRIHEIVQSVNINHKNKNIIINAKIEKESDKKLLNKRKKKILDELLGVQPFLNNIGVNLEDVNLKTILSQSLLETTIILSIAKNIDIYEVIDEFITKDDIDDKIEKLKAEKVIEKDVLELSKDYSKFKKMFEIFVDNNNKLEEFFFTDYVQNMISKCFIKLENNFNVDWESRDRNSRIMLLKNSPTALYFLLFMDELVKMPNFNISSNQNGVLMFDSILSFGLFNDIYHHASKINYNDVKNAIEKFEIFDRDYVLSKVYACRLLGDD